MSKLQVASAAALHGDLIAKLNDLKSIIEHPKLFVANHFDSLRQEIDLAVEGVLQAMQAENEESEQPAKNDAEQAGLNSIREAMIAELATYEKQFMGNVDCLVDGSSWQDSKFTLKAIEEKVESQFSLDHHQHEHQQVEEEDQEECYERLAIQILYEKSKREKMLLAFQTFMFFHSAKNSGILIHLPDVYLSAYEMSCVKAYLSNEKHSVMVSESFEILGKLMQEESRKLLKTRLQAALVVDSKLSSMAFLCVLIKAALSSDTTQHIIRLQKSFLDLDFKQLDPSGQELKNTLDKWMKTVNAEYRKSSKADPFAFATHIDELDFCNKGLVKFTLTPKIAANISHLSLSNNRLSEFDEDFFKSLSLLTILELKNAFDYETRFSLDFLSRLKSLTAMELTLPPEFEIKHLRKKSLDHVILHDAATRDFNLPRTKLLKPFWNLFAEKVMSQLWHLQLNGFEIPGRQAKMLPQIFMDYSKHVARLNLRDNRIFCLVPGCFDFLYRLEMLSVSHNLLTELPRDLFNRYPRLLVSLDFSSNRISELPPKVFTTVPNLEYLNLSNNELTHIKLGHFNNCNRLMHLDLSKNPIQDIDANAFGNVGVLEALILSHCKLKSLNNGMFYGLDQLKCLDLSNNQIESINLKTMGLAPFQANKTGLGAFETQFVKTELFSYFSSLESFNLTSNCLAEFNLLCFYNLRKLEELQLSNNKLVKLESPERCPYLYEEVYLSGNQIQSLDDNFFRPFEALRILDLENNLLEFSIGPDTFAPGVRLQTLKLLGNRSVTIQDGAWKRLSQLNKLGLETGDPDLAANMVNMTSLDAISIHKSDQATFEELFTGKAEFLGQLTSINFSHCSIATLDAVSLGSACPQLSEIILSGNAMQLIKPEWFIGLPLLAILDLSNNLIESVEDAVTFVSCKTLQHLKLGRNNIKSFNPDVFGSLTHLHLLDLSDNCLQTIENSFFSQLASSLGILNLSGNSIKKLNMAKVFRHMNKLHTIDLSNNQLDNSSINHEAMERLGLHYELKDLNLSGNQLVDITFIRNLSRLERLNLSNNQITSIYTHGGSNLFGRLVSLKHLDLSRNRLSIHRFAFDKYGKRLEHLDISNNKPVDREELENPSKRSRISPF